MPTNLPPEYYEVEKRYKAATSQPEKIRLLEELISTVPKHKGTEKLLGDMRRRLSKLKASSQTRKGGSRQESAFHIEREGAGQAVVVGLPNVGKSSLVVALTNATPEVDSGPYTTWTPTPGMMLVGDVQIQLVDTPPLNREYIDPELLELIRRADLVVLMVDMQDFALEQLDETVAILEGHRIAPRHRCAEFAPEQRMHCREFLVVVNKIDDEEFDADYQVLCELLADQGWTLLPASASTGRHLDRFQQAVFEIMDVIRVYAKPPGKDPDLSAPFVLKSGSTIADLAAMVHQDFFQNLKSARVWGSGVFDGQPVGREYVLQDGDIVELKT